jgi:hypothetical protein
MTAPNDTIPTQMYPANEVGLLSPPPSYEMLESSRSPATSVSNGRGRRKGEGQIHGMVYALA